MNILESGRTALGALWANKLRAMLTMLGIIIGVAAVITMVSLGAGAQKSVTDRLQALGSNLLYVRPGSSQQGRVSLGAGSSQTLELRDADLIRERVPTAVAVVPEYSGRAQAKAGALNTNTTVLGTTPAYVPTRNFTVAVGRFFTESEAARSERVCVLGATTAGTLFPDAPNPVGRSVRVRDVLFTVIGVLEAKGSQGFQDPDDQIVVPLEAARQRVFGADNLTSITVQVGSDSQTTATMVGIENLLRNLHRLAPGTDNDFSIRNQQDVVATITETNKTFSQLLLAIAGVSLLVGGIGIMNIMLVSVTERTREIGVRKAIGARSYDVMLQFLIESSLLSIFGGLLGIALGVGLSTWMSKVAGWNSLISTQAIIISFLFSAAVGVFFGLYPAQRAARANVIEALRYE